MVALILPAVVLEVVKDAAGTWPKAGLSDIFSIKKVSGIHKGHNHWLLPVFLGICGSS